MRWIERVKTMIRSWLEIQPASGKGLVIREPVSFETNVLRNRIWYRGDACELDQLFKLLGDDEVSRARFWAAAPEDESIRKAHSGLPGIMVDILAGIVKADLNELDFDGPAAQDAAARWAQLAEENDLPGLVSRAVADTLVTGDGAFKISLDPNVSTEPILEFRGADQVEYRTSHGRIQEICFLSPVGERGRILREVYAPGRVQYELLDADKVLPVTAEPGTAALRDVTFAGDFMLAVPLQFWPSARWRGRGQSIFDKKTDAFDAHDEIISQWMDAVRAGRVQRYIPESLIPRNPENGALRMPNAFGCRFVAVHESSKENADDKIQTEQPDIRYDAFLASYTATLDMCLQGIMSPATLGIDLGKMSSADAQREKKGRDRLHPQRHYRCAGKSAALPGQNCPESPGYPKQPAARRILRLLQLWRVRCPQLDSRVQTVAAAAGAGLMSVEAQVDELWGSSKDDAWKAAEVQRIRLEQGITDAAEPELDAPSGLMPGTDA